MEKNVRLFVLAGGKGERFFPFSSVIPKCLIPVAGKPCIRWIIEDALAQGFNDIVLCINKSDSSSYRHELRDVNLKYSISEEAHGTVGELLCARNFVTGRFVLRYGDDLTETNYPELLRFHVEKKAIATLVVTTELDLPVGIVDVAECGKVAGFVEKPKLGRPSWVLMFFPECFGRGSPSMHSLCTSLGMMSVTLNIGERPTIISKTARNL
jgi:NDP-sugar pyrophosphorylase family protein